MLVPPATHLRLATSKTCALLKQQQAQRRAASWAFFDTLRVAGGSYKTYTSDAKNLAQAQISHADAVANIERTKSC